MLFSPRSLLSCMVASLVLASATNAAVLQARQSAAATTTTCTYTWMCDSTMKYYEQSEPTHKYLRCTRNAEDGPNANATSCYYPMKGGNAATGESTHYDTAKASQNGNLCPDYAIRSSTDSSCQTMKRRAINLNPYWTVNRQAVIRRNVDGSGIVVPQAKSTGKDWRMRR